MFHTQHVSCYGQKLTQNPDVLIMYRYKSMLKINFWYLGLLNDRHASYIAVRLI
jgi:hypothetical protein